MLVIKGDKFKNKPSNIKGFGDYSVKIYKK